MKIGAVPASFHVAAYRFFPYILILVFFCAATYYSSHQGLWVDESTQMSGISLPLDQQLRWLAGEPREEIRVPADRMPPGSYWLHSAWAMVVGEAELHLRILGVMAAIVALLVLFRQLTLCFGPTAGLTALAVGALSPNLIVISSELRAYPFLLMFSTLALDALLRIISTGGTGRGYAYLLVACIAASYTHYFGVVLSFALFGALFLWGWRSAPPSWVRPLRYIIPYVIALAGLVPFLLAARAISDGSAVHTQFSDIGVGLLRLVYRSFSHQSMAVLPMVNVVVFVAGMLLAILGAVSLRRWWPVALVLGFGFMSVLGAAVLIPGLDPLSPSYNLWMFPFVITLIAVGATYPYTQRMYLVATRSLIVLLLAGSALGTAVLVITPSSYGHTRAGDLRAVVDEIGVKNTTVVFVNVAGRTFLPMHFWFGEQLDQYVPASSGWRNTFTGETQMDIVPRRCVVVASTVDLSARELKKAIWNEVTPKFPDAGHVHHHIKQQGLAVLEEARVLLAQEALSYSVYCNSDPFDRSAPIPSIYD